MTEQQRLGAFVDALGAPGRQRRRDRVALRPAGVAAAESTAARQPEQIRRVPRALQERGYQVAPTGAWDPGTSTALADFQSSSGLPATGQWDAATSRALGLDPSAVMPVSGTRTADPAVNCEINNTIDCLPAM